MQIFPIIPVMNEPELELTLCDLLGQTLPPTAIYVCVNQPENLHAKGSAWCNYEEAFRANQATLSFLKTFSSTIPIKVLDRSSPGCGWHDTRIGVGMARKVLMDEVCNIAAPDDVIFSCDADTRYPHNYLQSTAEIFQQNTDVCAVSNRYYHPLSGDVAIDYAMLRYEIYMRFYYLNLQRIGSPYLFTALGSSFAVDVKSYRKVGGMPHRESGEDFYFLQQMSKIGYVYNNFSTCAYPSTRCSTRVFFGTGPAIIKGVSRNFTYTVYTPEEWDVVGKIYEAIDRWSKQFNKNQDLIVKDFYAFEKLKENIFSEDLIKKFLRNAKTGGQFKRFCIEYFDGLKTLQMLRRLRADRECNDFRDIVANMKCFGIDLPCFDLEDLDSLIDLREELCGVNS